MNLDEIDHLLTTTKAVRRRLDLARPVPRDVVQECIELGVLRAERVQRAGVAVGRRRRSRALRAEVAEQYRAVTVPPVTQMLATKEATGDEAGARISRSILWLAEHLHEVPVIVFPCYDVEAAEARYRDADPRSRAARPRRHRDARDDLGDVRVDPARGVELPAGVAQPRPRVGAHDRAPGRPAGDGRDPRHPRRRGTRPRCIPVAYTTGGDFTRSPRKPVDDVIVWNRSGRVAMSRSEPLVVHVAYDPLRDVIDADRLAAIHRPPSTCATVHMT